MMNEMISSGLRYILAYVTGDLQQFGQRVVNECTSEMLESSAKQCKVTLCVTRLCKH